MNKITIAIITAATSVAFAQAPAAPAKEKAAPATPAKADPAKDAKAAAPAKDAKAAPAKMEMPKAPAEVAELGKKLAGTWKCTGQMADMADPTKMKDAKSTITFKMDADKAWLLTSVGGLPFKINMMSTYDPMSKRWYRITTDNVGGSETAWATQTGNKIVWDGEGRGMGMAPWKARTTEDMVSDKQVKMTGEMSMDGGKKWMTGWTADCKK